jgi:hypothetical protein
LNIQVVCHHGCSTAETPSASRAIVGNRAGVRSNPFREWEDPNGYPGGGVHERAKKLASRKPGDPHPFVDPATWDARAKRQLETARKVLAEEQAKAGATKAN